MTGRSAVATFYARGGDECKTIKIMGIVLCRVELEFTLGTLTRCGYRRILPWGIALPSNGLYVG